MCGSWQRLTVIYGNWCVAASFGMISLPLERRADPSSLTRAGGGHSRSGSPLLYRSAERRAATEELRYGGSGVLEALSLARKHPRIGESVRRLAALYSQEVIGVEVVRAELSELMEKPVEPQVASNLLALQWNACFRNTSTPTPTAYLQMDCMTGGAGSGKAADTVDPAATRGNQLKAAQILGLTEHAAQEDPRT